MFSRLPLRPVRGARPASIVAFALAVSLAGAACTSSATPETTNSDTTSDTTNGASVGTDAETTAGVTAGQPISIPADAVAIDYFVAKGEAPLLKETLVPLTKPTKTVTMVVNNITYAGVVCGFSFTGADRPVPPISFRMQIEQADGAVVDGTVSIDWTGDVEKAGSTEASGWNFLSDAQVNRNGPGWVVQVGGIPSGGGNDKPSPKRALCTATSSVEMPTSVGPVAYWAGFATR